MEENKAENLEIKQGQLEIRSEEQILPKDESVLKLLDSINNHLLLMNSLSSTLRQGWLELASARQSMGFSRVSSALFDLKYHRAATLMEVDHNDADSSLKQPHFTLHKWVSTDNQDFSPEEAKFEEDQLSQRKSSSPHNNDGASKSSEYQEKRPENNGPEVLSSPSSPRTPDNHIKKERAKTLSMFGTLVSPKLRAAQLSFETVLEALQEVANVRSSMLLAYEQVLKEIEVSKI
ncbi:coiled-coil domain-containing protein 115-like [Heracleum sosnowskyi]|uniref:Vacuolar ATPase assembly protein VMA22 n=1 Tax=Heracleum sosnowskyi TaxID=360622 RepID=A0AAD8IWP3_9APIA|nr:coiled-coil domain-containing protein 115-like [Heracleum sosnowskyi]